jgi:hypothetical protein
MNAGPQVVRYVVWYTPRLFGTFVTKREMHVVYRTTR